MAIWLRQFDRKFGVGDFRNLRRGRACAAICGVGHEQNVTARCVNFGRGRGRISRKMAVGSCPVKLQISGRGTASLQIQGRLLAVQNAARPGVRARRIGVFGNRNCGRVGAAIRLIFNA